MTTLLSREGHVSQDHRQDTLEALAVRIIADAASVPAPQRATVGVSPMLIEALRIELAKVQRQEQEAA